MAAAKKLDAKALKEKKQKKMAAILLIVLIGAMAFSIPKTLKMMNQQPAAATPPVTTSATPTTPAPVDAGAAPAPVDPAAAGAAAVAAGTGAAGLTGVSAPDPSQGLLISFERFETKDPFKQQIRAGSGSSSGDGTTDPAAPGAEAGAKPDEGSSGTGGEPALPPADPGSSDGTGFDTGSGTATDSGTTTTPGTTTPTGPVADPTSASITVNGGAAEDVAVDARFPAAEPLFQLVELTKTGAKIAIADGNYENGAETITLTVGKPVTLMNTADGTRYEILLVSVK